MELQLESITKVVRGQTHLHEMSLTLKPGLNILLGPTTAGKTSLMRVMAGLDHPTSGRVLENGVDVTRRSVKQRSVAFVYQQFINYPNLTVFENIASPLRIRGGYAKEELQARVHATAKMMQIDSLLDRLPDALSGGQQQRTAIARALIKESDLLFMDEPLVNLDYKLREELRAEMQNIFAQRDAIVIYSTTEPSEALMLGGTVFMLDAGRLLQSGATLDTFHHPESERAGQIFSDPPMNLIPAQVAGDQLEMAGAPSTPLAGHMDGLPEGRYRVGVRANHVRLAPSSGKDVSIAVTVELAEITGSETFVHTVGSSDHKSADDSTEPVRIIAQLQGVHQFEQGQSMTVHLTPTQLYLFDGTGRLAAAPVQEQSAGPAAGGLF